MRRAIVYALAVSLCGSAIAEAEPLETRSITSFRPLILENVQARWAGERGQAPTLTYAFVTSPTTFKGARNCGGMTAVGPALERSRIAFSAFRRETASAFAMWAGVANLRFIETPDLETADILIGAQTKPLGRAFTNVSLEIGRGTSAARHINRSLICLNPDMPWKIGFDGNLNAYDIRFTMAHEIGHAIGLDHPGASGQLMSYRYDERHASLQPGDVAGAVALYGPATGKPSRLAKRSPRRAPTTTGAIRNSLSFGLGSSETPPR